MERTSMPSLCMITVGIVLAAWTVFALLMLLMTTVMNMGIYASGLSGSGNDLIVMIAIQAIQTIIGLVVDVLGIIQGAVIALAGVQLRNLGNRGMVLAGAILCLIQPLVTVFSGMFGGCGLCGCAPQMAIAFVALLVGVWVLVTVNDAEVVATWESGVDSRVPEF